MSVNYSQLTSEQLADLLVALQTIDEDCIRDTSKERSFILRHISPPQLVEVLHLMNQRKAPSLAALLSGEEKAR